MLELLHQAWQGRFGRRGPEDEENLFLDVREKAPQVEAGQVRDHSEHDEDEQERRGVDACHQLAQRHERPGAIGTDRECHRAEGANGRDAHNQPDHSEQGMPNAVKEIHHWLAGVAKACQGQAEQDGEQ